VTQTVPAITPTPSQDAVKEWAQNDVRVTPDVWSQTYADDAGTYQFASVSVPALTGAPQTVTDYYATLKMNFIARADVLAEQAKADRGSASARPYDITQSYLVECNSGGFISVRHASMEDQGGAHGETRTFCDNFRLSDGKLLTLDDFFKAERAVYLPVLIDEIKTQLAAKSGDFYVGWEEYVENEEVFPFDAFVMTPGGLSLFYSESVIAPYVIGTIRVDIPWESIENIWTLP
jgi:hypothetical protein